MSTSRRACSTAPGAVTEAGLTNVELIQADAASLPGLADASFDVVLCSAGLLYLPVGDALREWCRLLVPGGLVGFSTMREGFPVAARIFREHAGRHGLHLDDPATPLGTESRCATALRDAGLTPAAMVAETVRFSPGDLERAWEAHVHGAHHDAVATLDAGRTRAFRHDYTRALAESARTDEERVLNPEVIYAFGHKPSRAGSPWPPPTARRLSAG